MKIEEINLNLMDQAMVDYISDFESRATELDEFIKLLIANMEQVTEFRKFMSAKVLLNKDPQEGIKDFYVGFWTGLKYAKLMKEINELEKIHG